MPSIGLYPTSNEVRGISLIYWPDGKALYDVVDDIISIIFFSTILDSFKDVYKDGVLFSTTFCKFWGKPLYNPFHFLYNLWIVLLPLWLLI